jgi:hypothetical protein
MLYQTEFTVGCPEQAEVTSFGSSVAPTTVPLRLVGKLRIGSALGRSSFAGVGGTLCAGAPDAAARPTTLNRVAAATLGLGMSARREHL